MAFRIEYYRGGKAVMIVSCPKTLDEAITDSAAGLQRYDAERAFIRDIDGRGRQDTIVEREN